MRLISTTSLLGVRWATALAVAACNGAPADDGGGTGGTPPPPGPGSCIEKCSDDVDCLDNWICAANSQCKMPQPDTAPPPCSTDDDCVINAIFMADLYPDPCTTDAECISSADDFDKCAAIAGGRCVESVACDPDSCTPPETAFTLNDVESSADFCICALTNWACEPVHNIGTCVVVCATDEDCSGWACDSTVSRCVECVDNDDCTGDLHACLSNHTCGCNDSTDCGGHTPECYPAEGLCGCGDDSDCEFFANTSLCNTETGACQCVDVDDCTADPLHPSTVWVCE